MHIATEDLLELVDEHASPETRQRIQGHMDTGCASCRDRLAGFRQLVETMATDRSAEPPAPLVEAAIRLFDRGPEQETVLKWLRGVAAEIGRVVFDSLAAGAPAFAGARSGASSRRVRFEGADLELDVQIEDEAGAARLVGQVLTLGDAPRPAAHVRYLVTAGGEVVGAGEADAAGEFLLGIPRSAAIRIHLMAGEHAARFTIPAV